MLQGWRVLEVPNEDKKLTYQKRKEKKKKRGPCTCTRCTGTGLFLNYAWRQSKGSCTRDVMVEGFQVV